MSLLIVPGSDVIKTMLMKSLAKALWYTQTIRGILFTYDPDCVLVKTSTDNSHRWIDAHMIEVP